MNPKIGIYWWYLTSSILCFIVNITGIHSSAWVWSQLMQCATVGIFMGLFNFMSSFCLCLLNWWSWTECWSSYSYFRASYKFLRQHEVLHRLHVSAVPFDAICAWNVCVTRESSSACTNFIQPREFWGFGSGWGRGFISEIWRRGTEWSDSEASRQRIMRHEGPQCPRTSDIPGRFDASRWGRYVASKRRQSITQWHSVITQENGIPHTSVYDV